MKAAINTMEDAGVGIVVGLPGGGKSLYLCELVSHLPGWIFGNIDLLPAHPAFERYRRIGASHGFPLWDWKEGKGGIDTLPAGSADVPVWIIVDEAHIKFHQFLFAKSPFEMQRRFVEYISTHRKRHHRLIFATQKISKIWKEIRNVSQFVVLCFDEAKTPSMLHSFLPKSLMPFKRVMFPDDTMNPSEVLAMETRTRVQVADLFPLYNTRQIDHD